MAADEQTHRDLDAPAPPGSPMRDDVPDANVMPGPDPSGDRTPPTQADFENAQAENAETSLDQPSDDSGSE